MLGPAWNRCSAAVSAVPSTVLPNLAGHRRGDAVGPCELSDVLATAAFDLDLPGSVAPSGYSTMAVVASTGAVPGYALGRILKRLLASGPYRTTALPCRRFARSVVK